MIIIVREFMASDYVCVWVEEVVKWGVCECVSLCVFACSCVCIWAFVGVYMRV